MTRLLRLVLLAAASVLSSRATGAPSVYYLAVGSSRYLAPADPRDHGFQRLNGARNGAVSVSDRLAAGGARFGIVLSSPEGSIVGLADFNKALGDLLAHVAADEPADALVIVYIAAHGISDGFGWNHFSVPGDLTYRGDPERLPTDQLADQAIYAAAVADRLAKARVHYLLILDTCYEGKPSDFQSPVLSQTASGNIGAIAQALRFSNEFHQADPVLFSTTPGSSVPVAPDPTDPLSNSMGPLARRLVLLIDAKTAAHQRVTVADIVQDLRSPGADSATGPAVTNARSAPWWSGVVVAPGAKPAAVDDRSGTASSPRLCCVADVSSSVTPAVPLSGSITLVGAPGEFITDGKSIILRSGMTLERPDVSTLTLRVSDNKGDWEFDFSTGGPLRVGAYADAQRAGFSADGHPGLAISGHAHACNEVHGHFEVESLPGAKTGRLALRFTQLCDDVAAPLTGTIDVQPRQTAPTGSNFRYQSHEVR